MTPVETIFKLLKCFVRGGDQVVAAASDYSLLSAHAGRRANGSVGCTGCHQDSYLGEGTQPRLAGQGREYLLQSMLDFRTRKRGNNPGMSDLMLATSEDDLKAMAEYLAGL